MAANARKTNASGEANSAAAEVGAEVDVPVLLDDVDEPVWDAEVVREPIFLLVVTHFLHGSGRTYWS